MFKYKIEKVISTHSYISHQISVITLSDQKGNIFTGIAVSPIPISLFSEATYSEAMGDYGKPLIIDARQAMLLCAFIENVLNGILPSKILVRSNGPALRIILKKYMKNWHDGGAYKGSVTFGGLGGFGFFSNSTVTKHSLVELKNSLIKAFNLESKKQINT